MLSHYPRYPIVFRAWRKENTNFAARFSPARTLKPTHIICVTQLSGGGKKIPSLPHDLAQHVPLNLRSPYFMTFPNKLRNLSLVCKGFLHVHLQQGIWMHSLIFIHNSKSLRSLYLFATHTTLVEKSTGPCIYSNLLVVL